MLRGEGLAAEASRSDLASGVEPSERGWGLLQEAGVPLTREQYRSSRPGSRVTSRAPSPAPPDGLASGGSASLLPAPPPALEAESSAGWGVSGGGGSGLRVRAAVRAAEPAATAASSNARNPPATGGLAPSSPVHASGRQAVPVPVALASLPLTKSAAAPGRGTIQPSASPPSPPEPESSFGPPATPPQASQARSSVVHVSSAVAADVPRLSVLANAAERPATPHATTPSRRGTLPHAAVALTLAGAAAVLLRRTAAAASPPEKRLTAAEEAREDRRALVAVARAERARAALATHDTGVALYAPALICPDPDGGRLVNTEFLFGKDPPVVRDARVSPHVVQRAAAAAARRRERRAAQTTVPAGASTTGRHAA